MRTRSIFLSFIAILLLAACSTSGDDALKEDGDVNELYNKAAYSLDKKNYVDATKYFQEVERQHPYSKWATQAQLMAAYSSYLAHNYDEATLALDRFIELHPGSEDVDYAYYLKALSYYEQISDVRRDQLMTEEAMNGSAVTIAI